MANKTLAFSEALTFGWETFKSNALFLIGVVVAVGVINGVVAMADEYGGIESNYTRFVINVIEVLVNGVLKMGLIVIALKFRDGTTPEFADLFNRLPLILHYIAATMVYLLMVAIGLVFFIVPGIYLAVRFSFYGYFIVDEHAGPIEALKKSSALTDGVRVELFLFFAMLIGINVVGTLALLVGLLVTMPLGALATAFVFRNLQSQDRQGAVEGT